MNKQTGKLLPDKGKIYFYDDIVILNGKRTPFGSFNGSYSKLSATDLGANLTRGLLEDSQIDPEKIDQLIFSNAIPSSNDAIFIARHIALKSGLNYRIPASLAQRICASGMETIISAANDICLGASEYTIAGGTENMTRAPLVSFELRNGFKFGEKPFTDLLFEGLNDTYCGYSMGQTAELLAEKLSISRKDCDDFAFLSHSRAIKANENGYFKDEILQCLPLLEDETIRSEIKRDKLDHLKPVFSKDGVQTAGNSSLISDGAAAVIITRSKNESNYIGKILSACIVGEKPELMGIAPVNAIKNLLQYNALTKDDIDLYEINEAFAAQYLAVEKLLELDRDKVNVNGGSIAIGHPLVATGTRLVITVLNELNRKKLKLGVASACIGGGQAIAVLVESRF